MTEIIAVRFKNGGKEYYFDPHGVKVQAGDQVIIETAKGAEFGVCSCGNTMVQDEQVVQPLRPLLRIATEKDLSNLQRNKEREKEALKICQEKIEEHELDMGLVRCESSFDGNKLLFFFTSEGRVDFRALVKDLATTLHCRIELRQIGVRDESKLLGGLGICGRPYCCNAFLEQFHPVSIKMAKTQGLSLNPAKISGACGRLMCCLKYEQDAYEDAVKRLPKKDSFVETPDGVGVITDVDMLKERVKVRLENAPDLAQTYAGDEIRVVRSGKGPRPEGYVAPPQSELEKLRKSTPKLIQPEQKEHITKLDNNMFRSEAGERKAPSRKPSPRPKLEQKTVSGNRGKDGQKPFPKNNKGKDRPTAATQPGGGKDSSSRPRPRRHRNGGKSKPQNP